MISELSDDWRPDISPGLVDFDTPELGSSANKMLHVVYRVGNMDRTINFYKDVFGMKVRIYTVADSLSFASSSTEDYVATCGWLEERNSHAVNRLTFVLSLLQDEKRHAKSFHLALSFLSTVENPSSFSYSEFLWSMR